MKVMVISPYLPHVRVGHGGGTAVRDLVTWLARDHQVLLVSLLRPGEADHADEITALSPAGNLQVATIPFIDNMARGKARLRLLGSRLAAGGQAVRTGYPLFATKYWSRRIRKRVLQLAAGFQPDAVQVEYLQLAMLCRDLRLWRDSAGGGFPRLVLNSHELGSLPRERQAAQAANVVTRAALLREAAAWRRLQVDASHWADRTLCVTPGDRELFEEMGGINLETVPLGMDLDAIKADWQPAEPERYLFVGSFGHRPNVMAARFLVKEVWPNLARRRPQAQLLLAGRGSDLWFQRWQSDHPGKAERVQALGFVPDIGPLFRESRLFLAPLAEGGGIKIKILEAMARGIPVVTTPIGCEGICEPADEAVFLADTTVGFQATVMEAVSDPADAARRAGLARELIEKNFSWEAIAARLAELYR
jgi:glycosyltransferase involved in cell wall biosynthesis